MAKKCEPAIQADLSKTAVVMILMMVTTMIMTGLQPVYT